jgi:hypothetical protein
MKCYAIIIATLLLAVGCTSVDVKPETSAFEDAVRIKPEVAHKYVQLASTAANRDGRTLRGVVSHVLIKVDSANRPVDTVWAYRDKYDSTLSDQRIAIPLRDIELLPSIFPGIAAGDHGGINLVENYHVTENIPSIRQLPILYSNALDKPCDCEPFSLSLALNLKLRCIDRTYSRFTASALGRVAGYVDGNTVLQQGKLAYGGDVIAGYRLGEDMRWMAGLTLSSGLPTVNAGDIPVTATTLKDLSETLRPLGLLTGRYYFVPLAKRNSLRETDTTYEYIDERGGDCSTCPDRKEVRTIRQQDRWVKNVFGCIKPYVYGELGMAFDALTRGAASMALGGPECSDCVSSLQNAKANGSLNVNWSMPVSFGLGVGIDIPIASFLDLEIDLGYRNIAVGDGYRLLGFTNVPDVRRLESFQLRIGVMY